MRASYSKAAVSLFTPVLALALAGCGNSTGGNPTPTIRDSGTDTSKVSDASRSDASRSDARPGSGSGSGDATTPPTDAPIADVIQIPDVSLDTGTCVPTSTTCNSCYTDAQAATNPYNACSPYTKNCVPFTTAVPTHPQL
jgi:hypothetical protein